MDKIQKRFDELAEAAVQIDATKKITPVQRPSSVQYFEGPTQYYTQNVSDLDWKQLIQWRTSVFSLLARVFGETSPTYQQLVNVGDENKHSNRQTYFDELRAIFLSAKEDFEGGYLFDVRNLVHSEVFSDELDQAEHFLELKFKVPAAVIAGTVIETTLRSLCDARGIDKKANNGKDKMSNAMIDDLAKVPVFNKMRADLLRAWVKIRNAAAHGQPEEFDEGDVKRMIEGIRDFIASQLS